MYVICVSMCVTCISVCDVYKCVACVPVTYECEICMSDSHIKKTQKEIYKI